MGKITVKTERLLVVSRTLEEMQVLYGNEKQEEMRQVYKEMIEEMQKCHGCEEWACDWEVVLADSGTSVGGIGFKGLPDREGIVELGYGIDENYRNNGYAREAVAGMVKWALACEKVKKVQAQTEIDNVVSQKILLKNGFQLVGKGEEGPLYEIRQTDL